MMRRGLKRVAVAPTYEVVREADGWAVVEQVGTAPPVRIMSPTLGLEGEAAGQVLAVLRRAVRAGWRAGLARAVLALEDGPTAGPAGDKGRGAPRRGSQRSSG